MRIFHALCGPCPRTCKVSSSAPRPFRRLRSPNREPTDACAIFRFSSIQKRCMGPPKDADFQSLVFRLWRPPVKRAFPKKFHWKHASNLEHFLHEIITVWSLQKVYQLLFKKPISIQWLYLLTFKYYKIYSIYSDNF